jgi:hypothetical protein
MTEQEIRAQVMHLFGALANNDERGSLDAARNLATQVSVDMNRIANALEKIAAKG